MLLCSYRLYHTILFLSLSILLGCDLIDPPEDTASFIQIDQLTLTTQPSQGTSSNAISDAWVYINDELVGAFELPATVPILASGSVNLKVYAGIKNNGLTSSRVRYPFYTPYETTITLIPDSIIPVTPTITYYNDAIITIIEDFESAGINFIAGSTSDTNIVSISSPPADPSMIFEYIGSGVARLDVPGGKYHWESLSNLTLNLPMQGTDVYLELNYACNDTILTGVVATNINGSSHDGIIYLYPTYLGNINPIWNKIYIHLTPSVSASVNADYFELYFELLKNSSVNYNYQPEMYLDNVKIIHW